MPNPALQIFFLFLKEDTDFKGSDCVDDFFFFFALETDCTTLFSRSRKSGFSNDFPSHDEAVRTEGLLSEPLPVSLGVLQGCVLGPGTFTSTAIQ